MNTRYPLHQVTKSLVAVATGKEHAEMVIKNGTLVNVCTKELIPGIDIAITHGRIALVGDATHTIGPHTKIIDASHQYMAPGFMDGHIHVESSMLTLREYSRLVMAHGTTSIFMDPHEIANVLGIEGVRMMMNEAKLLPLRVYTTVPSCVPAASLFEDSGAQLTPDIIRAALAEDDVIGLGEMMNFPGILNGDDCMHQEVADTLRANKTVTGHYAIPETGAGLNAYIAAGARCCHESVRKEDALAKMRLGMYAQIREGSAWHDVKETIRSITEESIDPRFGNLVSDDTHPHTLLTDGHLDHIMRRAIEEGLDPITAIQMTTINVAECFGLSRDLGSITPGKWADIVLLDNLESIAVNQVLLNGELVAAASQCLVTQDIFHYPPQAKNTIKLAKPLSSEDFHVIAPQPNLTTVSAHVIEIIEANVMTHKCIETLDVATTGIQINLAKDIVKVSVIERHHHTGSLFTAFVKGFRLKRGAVASTVAHDCHNLMVIGTNDEDMAFAANTLAYHGGGMVAVLDGNILALNPLPIAGLMSEDLAEIVAQRVDALDQAWHTLGCDLISPFMTMALLALPVIPDLRITNKGLIDVIKFTPIALCVIAP